MPEFLYRAYDSQGRPVSGRIEADTPSEALQALSAQRLAVYDITTEDSRAVRRLLSFDRTVRFRLGLSEWVDFFGELSLLMAARLPLEQGLQLVSLDAYRSKVRRLAHSVRELVISGYSLSQALNRVAADVPGEVLSIVRAAEAAGTLDKGLMDVADLLRYRKTVRDEVLAASAYPAFLVVLAILLLILLSVTFIPAILPIFEQVQAPPPRLILFLESIGRLFNVQTLLVAVLLSSLAIYAVSKKGEAVGHFMLKLPFVSEFVMYRDISVYARVLATMLENGVPLNEALPLAAQAVRNAYLRGKLRSITKKVEEGSRLSQVLADISGFPVAAMRFIQIGEEAGQLAEGLSRASQFLNARNRGRTRLLSDFVGPFLVILVGLFIGSLVLSIMQAIMQINSAIVR